jgi:hypothetical protein
MEVLLNLSKCPAKQDSYLKAVIRQIGRLINEIVVTMCIPDDDGTLWDVPGRVPGILPGYRFSVIEDPQPRQPMVIEEEQVPQPEVISDDE